MPIYTFYNTNTGELIDEIMPFSGKQQFLEENPHLQAQVSSPSIVSGVSLTDKVPGGFKEVLSKIAENNPNSSVADKIGGRGIKDAKIKSVIDKHVKKITKRLET